MAPSEAQSHRRGAKSELQVAGGDEKTPESIVIWNDINVESMIAYTSMKVSIEYFFFGDQVQMLPQEFNQIHPLSVYRSRESNMNAIQNERWDCPSSH